MGTYSPSSGSKDAKIKISMHEFLTLLEKIYPLYLLVAAGYVAGKFLKTDKDTVASLLIYIIAPVVVFNGVASAPFNPAYFLLPVIFFIVACGLSIAFYYFGGLFWQTSERNLLSFIAGTGNTGYFGIPLVLALFGNSGLSIAVFSTLGIILYESTRGYYIIAKSHATAKESLMKVIKLPVIYAFVLGVVANIAHVPIEGSLATAFGYFSGAFTVLGMMILGISLSSVTRASFDPKFTLITFIAKFAAFPLVIGLFVFIDAHSWHLFSNEIHRIMLILSIVPMATNTVTYASHLKAHPIKAAFTVLLSTLFGLIYIPLFVAVLLPLITGQ